QAGTDDKVVPQEVPRPLVTRRAKMEALAQAKADIAGEAIDRNAYPRQPPARAVEATIPAEGCALGFHFHSKWSSLRSWRSILLWTRPYNRRSRRICPYSRSSTSTRPRSSARVRICGVRWRVTRVERSRTTSALTPSLGRWKRWITMPALVWTG